MYNEVIQNQKQCYNITSEDAIKSFSNEGIYIDNIDFTQDFAGVINKTEVIQYLIVNKNYVMEGYNDNEDYIIMDNDKIDLDL